MEICIIYFDGSRTANQALDLAMERRAGGLSWLRDVTAIRRSSRGRVWTRPAWSRKRRRGGDARAGAELLRPANDVTGVALDEATLPSSVVVATNAGARGAREVELERDVIRVVELEDLLEPNSSALILIGERADCDYMEATFARHSTRTCRHDVFGDVDRTLRQLLDSSRSATSVIDG